MGIWKVRTLPYHAQTNRQMEGASQMLMCMIGKLGRDQEVDCPKHLPKLVHAYNSTRLAITRYSPHYLMFGHWPCLFINFYFPMVRGMKKHQHVDHYIAKVCEQLWEAFKRAQIQSLSEAVRQKWHYDRKLMPFHWNQVTWSWLKPMPTGEGGKWRTGGRRNHTKWSTTLLKASLPTSWKTSGRTLKSPPLELTLSHCSYRGDSSLCVHACKVGQVHHHHPRGTNSGKEWDWESVTKCELSIIGPASDRWDSSRMGE